MDLKLVQKHIETEFIAEGKTETYSFEKFIDLMELKNVEDPMLLSDHSHDEEDFHARYENQRMRDCPLFCRSAPWEKFKALIRKEKGLDFEDVVRGIDSKKVDINYRTTFQVGFVIYPEQTQMFEVTEYLCNFNNNRRHRNTDMIDIFGKKLKDSWSNVKVEAYQVQHILPSASSNRKFIGRQKFWENHRIVPKINNNGDVSGTYLMLNTFMIYKESVLITSDQTIIQNQKKNLGTYFNVIMANAGQEVLLLRIKHENLALIYLKSGNEYEVPLSILVDYLENPLNDEMEPKPMFIYQMFCTSDFEREPHLQFKTPIMQVGYK